MLEFEEYKVKLNNIKPTLEELGAALKLEDAKQKIAQYEQQTEESGFWDDLENSQKVLKHLKQLRAKIAGYKRLTDSFDDHYTICEMALEENDESMLDELKSGYGSFVKKLGEIRLTTLLSGEFDSYGAILSFHAGAGGTEAQDWASMLYRMYIRWAERHGFDVKTLDYLDGEEAGLKSATISIEGENAYGFLRSENGIHRLVRVSPFDASGRRHTSFAAVEVMPDIPDD